MAGGGGDSVSETIIKVGPGGRPGSSDTVWDLKGVSKITKIYISFDTNFSNRRIASLQFQYIEDDGKIKLSPVYGDGSFAASYFKTVELNPSEEYIIGLKGGCSNYPRYTLSSLTFKTNHRTYGPFGSANDVAGNFSFRFGPGNHFAGFYGTFNSNLLSSIGVYVRQNSEKMVNLNSVKAEGSKRTRHHLDIESGV